MAAAGESKPQSRTFSLVIPTYRRPDLAYQAAVSALRQHRGFDAILVVADGRDDPALSALAGLPVELVAIDHAGVAAARNAGVARARTDWVCFLDDDDLLHPDYLSQVERELADAPDLQAMNTWYWSFAEGQGDEIAATDLDGCLAAEPLASPRRDLSYLDIEGRSFDLLLERLRGSMSTAAIERRVLLAAGGFPVGMTSAEDWTMYVNVARFTEWHIVKRRLAFFRDHPGTNTRTRALSNGLMTLRAINSFWERTSLPEPPHRPLRAYRSHYQHVLGWTLAAATRSGDLTSWRQALHLARPILPERRDRLKAVLPERLRNHLTPLR